MSISQWKMCSVNLQESPKTELFQYDSKIQVQSLHLKLPWPHSSCILHACKTSIMWTIQWSAFRISCTWTQWYYGSSSPWMPCELNMGKHAVPQQAGHPRAVFSKESLWNKFASLHMLSGFPFTAVMQSTWLLFSRISNWLQLLGSNFAHRFSFSGQPSNFSNLSALFSSPLILTKIC